MDALRHFHSFVRDINASNSRSYKLDVLAKYKCDDVVRYLLKFVFDPFIVTGISRKKLAKDVRPDGEDCTFIHLLEYIKINNTGKDEVLARIKKFEEKILTLDELELFHRIICKNLPLGIETLTINKVMPKLISTFNVMLANKYFDKPEVVEGKEFVLTTKIDGGRIIAIKDDGVVTFYTRAGQKYEGLVDLEAELLEKFPDNIALDGEITLLNADGLDNKEQYKRTMMITRRLGEKHGIKMKIFDVMSAKDFMQQHNNSPYSDRRKYLENLCANRQLTFFEILPILYQGTDCSQIKRILDEQTAKGEEGIMINIVDEPYAFARTNALLKVKKMQDIDLVVVDMEAGTNQNANKLGAFIVEYKGCRVRVGSGISKELREKVWANKEDYIGMTISVQYFEETTNQGGGYSLRFPVFLDFREDK
nr:MAG TPA: DNA ligase [Caudoviricetes sp.]